MVLVRFSVVGVLHELWYVVTYFIRSEVDEWQVGDGDDHPDEDECGSGCEENELCGRFEEWIGVFFSE